MITSLFFALLLSSPLRAAAPPESVWVEDDARGGKPEDPG